MNDNKGRIYYFKLHEVIIMVVATCFLSFFAGSTIMELRMNRKNKTVNKEIQTDKYLNSFYENYKYIVDNYYKEIDKDELINGAIEGMMGKLDDPYTTYMDEDQYDSFNIVLNGSYNGLGVEIGNDNEHIYILGVISNSPASRAGLKAGDIIIGVNGVDVSSYSSNELSNFILNNKVDKEFTIKVIRGEEVLEFPLEKENIKLDSVASEIFERNGHKIGYIYISIFAANTTSQVSAKLKELEEQGIDSLIIDVRSNNGGHLTTAESISSLFVDNTHVVYQLKKNGKTTKYKSKGKKNIAYPVVVLVNSHSASAAELLTGCLKDNSVATIIGTKTYGKGSVQELVNLPNGDQYKITTKEWLTPNGDAVNGVGITPDIEVELSEQYILNPSDETDNQLQEAINYLAK